MTTRKQALQTIWDALHGFREDCIPEGDAIFDEQWNEICEAMAFVHEALNISHDEIDC